VDSHGQGRLLMRDLHAPTGSNGHDGRADNADRDCDIDSHRRGVRQPDSSVLCDVSSNKTPKDDVTNMTGWLPVCAVQFSYLFEFLDFEQDENVQRSFYGAGLKGC
jgi:hypothetical protein